MSVFTYNGINLPYPYHTSFSQEVIYEDVTGEGGGGDTDKAYSKFDITVAAVLNTNYLGYIGIDGQTNPAALMDRVRIALQQPRRLLSVTVGGTNLIPSPIAGGTVDAKNGPHPQYCNITQLTNQTFLVQYRIIAHYWENPIIKGNSVVNQPGGTVLYNRWQETVDMDELMMSTLTRKGKFVIRSDNIQGQIADIVRVQTAVTGVHRGFVRKSSSYTISPDGLSVSYTIIDQEVYKMPPDFSQIKGINAGQYDHAFKAKGMYTESTMPGKSGVLGTFRVGAVDLTLWGSKKTSQYKLIQAALAIGNSKLLVNQSAPNKNNPNVALTHKIELTVDMYNNMVHVYMAGLMDQRSKGDKIRNSAADQQMRLRGWVYTPGSDDLGRDGRGTQPPYTSRGTANIILQAAAYYDASLQGQTLQSYQFGNGELVGTAGVNKEASSEAEDNAGV